MNKRKLAGGALLCVLLGCTTAEMTRQAEVEKVETEVRNEMSRLVDGERFLEASQYRCPRQPKPYLEAAAERTRTAMLNDIVYPKWIDWHRQKLNAEVSRLVGERKFGDAREFIWQYGCAGVEEVDGPVDRIRYQLLAEKVNVIELDYMKSDLAKTYFDAINSGDVGRMVAAKHRIADYPEVRTYSHCLDGSLDSVRDALVSVKVPAASLSPILGHAKRMIADCFIDRKTNTKEKEGPDLTGSRARLAAFQADLMKYGCNAKQAEKVAGTFEAEVKPLLDEAVRRAKGGPDLVSLGTSSVNDKARKIQTDLIAKIDACVMSNLTAKLLADVNAKLDRKNPEKTDFTALRTAILKPDSVGDAALDARYLALRIGILNALVNPVQCRVAVAKMTKAMSDARRNRDDPNRLLDAYKDIGACVPADEDEAYREVLNTLKSLKTVLTDLDVAEDTASEFIQRKTKELLDRLNARSEDYADRSPRDMQALIDFLKKYEIDLQRHFDTAQPNYPARSKGAIWNEVRALLGSDGASMTTAEMIGEIRRTRFACNRELVPMLKTAEERQRRIQKAEIARKLKEALESASRARAEEQIKAFMAKLEELDPEWLEKLALSRIDTNEGADPRGKDGMNELLGEFVRINRRMAQILERDRKNAEDQMTRLLDDEENFSTLLAGAIYLGLDDGVSLLLEKRGERAVNVNRRPKADVRGRTPLLMALEFMRMNALAKLTANTNCEWTARDVSGDGVAHYAARSGNALILETVKENIDVSQTNAMGRTALYVAVLKDNSRLVRALVERGGTNAVKLVNWRDAHGLTPFAVACSNGCARAMAELHAKGAQYGGEDLRIAAAADQLTAVRWLVETGCVSVNSPGVMAAVPAGSQTERYLVEQGGIGVRRGKPIKSASAKRGKAKYVLCEIQEDAETAEQEVTK